MESGNLIILNQESYSKFINDHALKLESIMEKQLDKLKKSIQDEDVWLSKEEACKYLRKSDTQLERYASNPENGIIKSSPAPRHVMFLKSSLHKFLLKHANRIDQPEESIAILKRRRKKL